MGISAQDITCLISCKSAETLRQAIDLVEERIQPSSEITRTFVTFVGGIERREIRSFRLGDYFEKIELMENVPNEASTFGLSFFIKHDIRDTFWKDLLLGILRSIRESLPGISTSIMPAKKAV